ncbi:MAG: helix-turn-helix transcriptional regulator [Deltaproteobacteria bacterium]|jgi:transcriptional regulator with XRE-family HTH domain|nr:helix-turn-helix transcriptional regulator [Deltaproteobacteria bacterium]
MSPKTPPDNPSSAARRCIRCGAKAVKPRTGLGRTTRFRTMPTMPIPEDVAIPACGRCQSEYLDEATSSSLAVRLQEVYLQSLRTRARIAIDILSHHISQRRLEQLLGLSQGYLSRLRAGASNPSPELIGHLGILCQDPPARLEELERFWALPDEEWPPLPKAPSRLARSPHRYYPRKPRPPSPSPVSERSGSPGVAR